MGMLGDMMTMKPSETWKDSVTLDELGSLIPSANTHKLDKYGNPERPRSDPWGDYLETMQYLTQPKTDMGPDARRALGGMPPLPPAQHDPVEMQSSGLGSAIMSLLFGGAK